MDQMPSKRSTLTTSGFFERVKGSRASDSGQISTTMLFWIGFAVVALTAVAWIGNTAAGVSADTASCITTFQQDRGKYGEQDPCWSSDDNAKTANESRESFSGFTGGVGGFGSSTVGGSRENVIKTSKATQAIKRLLAKEGGSMNEIYDKSLVILNGSTCQNTASNVTLYNSCFGPINTVIDNAWIHERRNSAKAGNYDDVARYLEELNSPHKAEAKALASRYSAALTKMQQLNWDNDDSRATISQRTAAQNRAILSSEVAQLSDVQKEWIAINANAKTLLAKISG